MPDTRAKERAAELRDLKSKLLDLLDHHGNATSAIGDTEARIAQIERAQALALELYRDEDAEVRKRAKSAKLKALKRELSNLQHQALGTGDRRDWDGCDRVEAEIDRVKKNIFELETSV